MKHKQFYDAEHANRYLHGSLIRIDGKPAMIISATNVRNVIQLGYYFTGKQDEEQKTIGIYNQSVDMNPVPLGFVNLRAFNNVTTIRAFRTPQRAWKVGLTNDNLLLTPGDTYNKAKWAGDMEGAGHNILRSAHLAKTITGDFPSLEKAIHSIENGSKQVAFSRRFMIDNNKKVWFVQADTHVGVLKHGEISLLADYEYLTQLLTEDVK